MAIRPQQQGATPSGKAVNAVVELLNRGEAAQAEQRLQDLRKRHPKDGQLMGLLANALQKQDKLDEALAMYRQARQSGAHQVNMLVDYAQCLNRQGERDEAFEVIEQVLAKAPQYADGWIVKGDILRDTHCLSQAAQAYRQAQEANPQSWRLYLSMGHLVTFAPEDPVFEVLGSRLEKATRGDIALQAKEHANLHFILGKAFLDVGDDAQAFEQFTHANALMDNSLPPIRAELERRLGFTRRYFTPALFEALAPYGVQSRPQLIVAGMSRSGKSLVESLFRGVKGVSLAGEELVLGEYTEELLAPLEKRLPDYLAQLTPQRLAQDAKGYIERLNPGDDIKITTVPGDLWYLGLVGLWAPNVPIIFCVRNLLDLGVTGYFHQYLVPEGYRYSYDQHQLGRQIACSEKVMDHWAQVLPNPVYLVDYEALTRDPEGVMNNLLADLGLERETAYAEAVGQNADMLDQISPIVSTDAPMPVTERFIGIGERFRQYLGPMVEGYKTIADAFPRYDPPATFPQPLPNVLVQDDDAQARPSDEVTFDWQLPERIVALDNGAKLLHANVEALMALEAFSIVAFDPLSKVTLPESLHDHPNVQCFPHALLGSGQQGTLYACLDPAFSGTLAPQGEQASTHALQVSPHSGAQVLARLPIQTIALDAIEGLPSVDWLLLDNRHDSLATLNHGEKALGEVLAIQTQVSFQPTREREPNLAELSHWAARNGLRFHRLLDLDYEQAMTSHNDVITQPDSTRLKTGYALFLPSEERLQTMNDVQRLKLAFLLDTVYHIHDMTYELLRQIGGELGERYLKARGYFDKRKGGPASEALAAVREALAQGRGEAHLPTLKQWAKQYPRDPEVRALRGEVASWNGQHDVALSQLNKAIDLAPDSLSIRRRSVEVLVRAGLWWEAYLVMQALHACSPAPEALASLWPAVMAAYPQAAEPHTSAVLQQLEQIDEPLTLTYKACLLAQLEGGAKALEPHRQAEAALMADTPAWVRAEVFFRLAKTLQAANQVEEAAKACWQALSVRPATFVTQSAQRLLSALLVEAKGELTPFAKLHARLRELKKTHKGSVPMAEFDLLRQGLSAAWLPGSRPTEERLAAYELASYLPENARALDINAEQGCLLLGLAEQLSHAEGLGMSDFQQALCEALGQALDLPPVVTSSANIDHFKPRKKAYDLILACGAHRQKGLSSSALGESLWSLCAAGGIVLLESSGIRQANQVEPSFADHAGRIASAGFEVEHVGHLCDDGVNYREFWVLRKPA
ncbi:tetratricopeptide repeat protein [Halomonas sp. M1]|uniref:sulfotransferase n=1 Tax=Halomonas sp. M1 TaxID=3035470 RepID=UPI002485D564|nr:sulfotransferase [Halomonas sp. M1]WFE70724.1 tetratricopeptide repeat protein [Halomonas sp. M1]